jgi:hypothetical protein
LLDSYLLTQLFTIPKSTVKLTEPSIARLLPRHPRGPDELHPIFQV